MGQSLEEIVATLECKVSWQQGMIELLLGLMASKFGEKEIDSFMKAVANSHNLFSPDAKSVATECVRQNTLWSRELLEEQKRKPQ